MTAVELAGDGISLTVAPERGGKITSLRTVGREWLAPGDVGRSGETRSFVAAEMGGWDECAPTIDACIVDGVTAPDHGDVWARAWSIDRVTSSSAVMSVESRDCGFRLTREVSVGRDIRLEYTAEALDRRVPFLWAAHPQFLADEGSRVVLPPAVETVVDILAPGRPRLAWTPLLAGIDTVEQGGCRKVYVDPDSMVRSASIVHADGAELRFDWDEGAPYLGVWFDRGAYSAHPVIALEPCSGYADSLEAAVAASRATWLEPGETTRWSLTVSVGSAGPAES